MSGLSRRRLLLGAGAACALPLVAAGRVLASGVDKADSDGPRILTATDVHVSDYPTGEAVRWIGQTLERETGGRLKIRLYHSGQLGREAEAIDMARYGVIDITRVFSGALNNAFPLTQALCLPYVFDSIEHLRRVVDGDVMPVRRARGRRRSGNLFCVAAYRRCRKRRDFRCLERRTHASGKPL